MSTSAFNQLLEVYSVADEQEKLRLITSEISAPADFEEYLESTEENSEFYKSLFENFNKDFIKTLLLYLANKYGFTNHAEIIGTKGGSEVLSLFKDYIKTLEKQESDCLFDTINEYQLVPHDFT
ncbi:hypothetical protein IGK47_004449 [Enterococcus sp. AZ007]